MLGILLCCSNCTNREVRDVQKNIVILDAQTNETHSLDALTFDLIVIGDATFCSDCTLRLMRRHKDRFLPEKNILLILIVSDQFNNNALKQVYKLDMIGYADTTEVGKLGIKMSQLPAIIDVKNKEVISGS